MQRYSIIVVVGILILCLAMIDSAVGDPRREENLYYLVKERAPICVHLGKFINSSGSDQIVPEEFVKELEKALETRPDIRFKLVENPNGADISINGEIMEYIYSDHDPIDMFLGIWAVALDAVTTQDYVCLVVNYTVKDPKTGKVLWSKRLRPSVTKSDISEDQCTPLIMEKAAKQFISKSFERPKKR